MHMVSAFLPQLRQTKARIVSICSISCYQALAKSTVNIRVRGVEAARAASRHPDLKARGRDTSEATRYRQCGGSHPSGDAFLC